MLRVSLTVGGLSFGTLSVAQFCEFCGSPAGAPLYDSLARFNAARRSAGDAVRAETYYATGGA